MSIITFKTCMRSYLVGLEMCNFDKAFLCRHALCMRAAEAKAGVAVQVRYVPNHQMIGSEGFNIIV